MGKNMTHPPSYEDSLRNKRMKALRLTHYQEPLMYLWCCSDLVETRLVGDWSEETILDLLNEALTHPSIPEELHEFIRPWAEGKRPDLENKRKWAKGWKDIEVGSIYGYTTRISEGLNSQGEQARRYFFGGKRVDVNTYKTLTCEQTECPRHKDLLKRFEIKLNGLKPSRGKASPIIATKLEEEKEIDWQGQKVLARKARLVKVFSCPAHGPVRGEVEAWDLYGKEGYLCTQMNI